MLSYSPARSAPRRSRAKTIRATQLIAGAIRSVSLASISLASISVVSISVVSISLAGCHSAFIDTTLINRTNKTLRLVQVDYPTASFGTQALDPEAYFHYRFKVIGEGPIKLSWTDDLGKEHDEEGPRLHEGQQGTLIVTVIPGQTAWQSTLR